MEFKDITPRDDADLDTHIQRGVLRQILLQAVKDAAGWKLGYLSRKDKRQAIATGRRFLRKCGHNPDEIVARFLKLKLLRVDVKNSSVKQLLRILEGKGGKHGLGQEDSGIHCETGSDSSADLEGK